MSLETQWAALKALGLPDPAAAVVMGHAFTESNCETNRLQGDMEMTRSWSKTYTSMVDSGEITRDDFIFRGPNGGGYGWLQWTEKSRKAGYYDNAKALGVSIGSQEAAVTWLWAELHQPVRRLPAALRDAGGSVRASGRGARPGVPVHAGPLRRIGAGAGGGRVGLCRRADPAADGPGRVLAEGPDHRQKKPGVPGGK